MKSNNEKTIGDFTNEFKSIKLSSIGRMIRVGWKLLCLLVFLYCGLCLVQILLSDSLSRLETLPYLVGAVVGCTASLIEITTGYISAKILRIISTVK